MAKLINKVIFVDNRYWTVLRVDNFLEVLHVQELGRNFKTVIGFEEVR